MQDLPLIVDMTSKRNLTCSKKLKEKDKPQTPVKNVQHIYIHPAAAFQNQKRSLERIHYNDCYSFEKNKALFAVEKHKKKARDR